ncbi:MAG: response regulator [Desulfovibrio sp.]
MEITGRKILIIDDEKMLCQTLADYLEDIGYSPLVAMDGHEGLEKFKQEHPEAILLDLNMPRVSGFEVLEEMTAIAPDIPIIVISGVGMIQDVIKAMRLGAWDFMSKPIEDLNVIDQSLKTVLTRAEKNRKSETRQRELEALVSQRTQELQVLNDELEMRVEERASELKKSLTDLQKAQEQLIVSEKMASLGNLVAGIAHEINTPIGLGVTAASFLNDKTRSIAKKYENNDLKRSDLEFYLNRAQESANSILTNLTRASELIQSFKQVSVDQTTGESRKIDIVKYIHEVLQSLKPRYKRTKHIISVHGPEKLIVKTTPGAIVQVLTNLVMNSLIHGFENIESGNITIECQQDGNALVLTYADDGIGMTREMSRRIFDPFFTTKRNQGGTGLGMHIVYNLITQKLNGTIDCSSTPGEGTSFIIRIPVEGVVDE